MEISRGTRCGSARFWLVSLLGALFMPNKKRKLSIPALDELDEGQVTALHDALAASSTEDRNELLLYLMSSFGISQLKLSQENLPSFSSATWEKVCGDFGLRANNGPDQLALFTVPDLCLPPSVHKRMLTAAMRTMDVYREPQSHSNEAARVRLFEAWHVPLCQLFRGRIVDKPEERLPATTLTSGGFVEHELFVLDLGLILLVYELKHHLQGPMGQNEAAQVFLEMQSAWTSNSDRGLFPQPPVYALLTDLTNFIIFKYDGNTFTRQGITIHTTFPDGTRYRYEFLSNMMPVAERLFSVIFHGFIEYLDAVRDKSKRRGDITRPSLNNWELAHILVTEARDALVRPALAHSQEDAEREGQKGLDLLDRGVAHLEKIGSLADWKESALTEEVQTLLDEYFPEPPPNKNL